MAIESYNRIVVVGTSGSGKSTYAKKLSRALGINYIELDSLHWEPNWVEAPLDVFSERVKRAIEAPTWVLEGNYGKVRDLTWRSAQTLVWLDYPFHIVFGRALFRTIKRALTREVLWAGNRESFRKSFFSKGSILIWVIQTYERRKREYPELLSRPEYSHLKVYRFKAPKEAESFLSTLT